MGYQLPHYLRTLRRRRGFTQAEVAYLVGLYEPAHISRYEHFKQQPSLETAFACEALFGEHISSIFAGTFAEVEAKTFRQAVALAEALREGEVTPRTQHTLSSLEVLLRRRAGPDEKPCIK